MSINVDFVVEVCVDSLDSAVAACAARESDSDGKIRLEICANLGVGGGTTPSLGLVNTIHREAPGVETMIMIRPRIGDFCYTKREIQVMCEDIRIFKESGATGVVFGALNPNGDIDIEKTQLLARAANGILVTFHRAFDMCIDGDRALRDLASIQGIHRILTSGIGKTAPQSIERIRSLHKLLATLNPKMKLLIGSGINACTLPQMLKDLEPDCCVKEIHLSGGAWIEGECEPGARKVGMGMGIEGENEWKVWRTQKNNVAETYRTFMEFRGALGISP